MDFLNHESDPIDRLGGNLFCKEDHKNAPAAEPPPDTALPVGPRTSEVGDIGAKKDLLSDSVIDAKDWEGRQPHPRSWLVKDYIPEHEVTLLGGDGGTGKSLLALMLAIARATEGSWLGLDTKPGGTVYLSCEDDRHELHRRAEAVRLEFGVSFAAMKRLTFIDRAGLNTVLGEAHGRDQIKLTPLFEALNRLLEERKPELLILDSLADIFNGDENSRTQSRQFVGLLKGMCLTHRVTILVLYHPSITGMSSGSGTSGNTAWSNSVRSRLYLERPKRSDPDSDNRDHRVLTRKKGNYAKAGDKVPVIYFNGVFKLAAEQSSNPERAAHADRVFMDLLRLLTGEGESVCSKLSQRYAPSIFAKHSRAEGVSQREFVSAMQRLMDAGKIKSIKYGPPSRERSKLVEQAA